MATITIVSPKSGDRVSGASVAIRAQIDGGSKISDVRFEIGYAKYGTVKAVRVKNRYYGYTWDSRRTFEDGSVRPNDSLYWITAKAVVDGKLITARYVPVYTANLKVSGLPAGGWRPELAWAAKYDGSLTQWDQSHSAVIGLRHATLVNDPVLGAGRKVIRASVPDSAVSDSDQTGDTTVRFQSAGKRNITEGDEVCVGFSILPPSDFPTTYGVKDPTNPGGRETGWINIFQFYGPPYNGVAPIILQANRRTPDDPMDEFFIARNSMNDGEPLPLLSFPYNRGKWTDIVMRIKVSRSIEKGWIEFYINQGRTKSVQAVPYINGLVRIPRVTRRADSEAFRTDMQIYRVVDRLDRVTLLHTKHRVGRTVADVDPKSYA